MKKTILIFTLSLFINFDSTAQDYYTVRDSAVARFERADYLNALYTYFYVDNIYKKNPNKYKNERNPKLWIEECKDSISMLITRIEEGKQLNDSLLNKVEFAIFDKAAIQNSTQNYFREWNYEQIDTLDLSYSNLTYLPKEVLNCKKLKSINLIGNNKLDIDSVFAVIKQLPRISDIKISINSLQQIPKQYHKWITGIKLNSDSLSEFPTEILTLPNLHYLDVSGTINRNNQFSKLPEILFQKTELRHLILENCQIKSLPANIGNLKNLRSLKLKGNQLTHIPTEIKLLKQLKIIGLEENKFEQFPTQICFLKNLKVLSLFNNKIPLLPKTLKNLTNLRVLYLWDNQIQNIPDEICYLTELSDLRLYRNKINDINPRIACLDNLKYLDLSSNQISTIPIELGTLIQLKHLSLSNNSITAFPPELANLINLGVLDLNNNKISKLPSQIKNMKSLVNLKLNNNKIEELPEEISLLKNLDEIGINNNKLTKLPKGITQLPSLKYIHINGNNLPPEEIKRLGKIGQFIIAEADIENSPGNTVEVSTEKNHKIIITEEEIKLSDYSEEVAGLKFEMVAIKGGTFTMGNNEGEDDEKPPHQVTISNFYMGKYEVTNAEICLFLNEKGNIKEGGTRWLEIESSSCKIEKKNSKFVPKSNYGKHPVVEFSWYGSTAYCKWLSLKTEKIYRLPTEAEWEYAAGGGVNNRTKWAVIGKKNKLGTYAWYRSNSKSKTHQVGTKKANQLGLHDMSGNVWEWCSNWYEGYSPEKNTKQEAVSNNLRRVRRGGSWLNYSDETRVAHRSYWNPNNPGSDLGFRLVSTAQQKTE